MSIKVCNRCVMDTTIKIIDFDEKGICNYCKTYEHRVLTELYKEPERTNKLNILIKHFYHNGYSHHLFPVIRLFIRACVPCAKNNLRRYTLDDKPYKCSQKSEFNTIINH